MSLRHSSRLVPGLALLALVAVACGSSPQTAAPDAADTSSPAVTASAARTPPASGESVPPPAAEQALPGVEVIDLADDGLVNVASLAPASKPVLVWFWAPH